MLALLLLLVTTPLPTDNGFISRALCPQVTWPTLPLDIYLDPGLTSRENNAATAAIDWWNTSGAAPVFHVLLPADQPSPFLIVILHNPDPTTHGHVLFGYFNCSIFHAEVELGEVDTTLEPLAHTIHLFGDALGLAHDVSMHSSIMTWEMINDADIIAGITGLTANDVVRLLAAIVL